MWLTGCGGGGDDASDDGGTSDASVLADARIVDYDGHSGQCLVSADCPLGSYCDLGVCVQDCDAETSCPTGTECSAHGRCLTSSEEDIDPPVTTESDDVLVVSPAAIVLAPGQTQAEITVSSASSSPFRFRATGGSPWMTVSHRQVTDVDVPTTVTVDIDHPQLTDGSYGAFVKVVSDIGTVIVPVQSEQGLGGRYSGSMVLDGPQIYARVPLLLDIKDLGVEQWARLNIEGTPHFSDAPTGYAVPSGADQVVITVHGVVGRRTPLNHWRSDFFGRPLGRSVVLNLTIGESYNLTGTYTETVTGLLETPFTVEGTVTLRRIGSAEVVDSFLVSPVPSIPDPDLQPPPITATCALTLSCPDPSDPSCPGPLQNALDLWDTWMSSNYSLHSAFQAHSFNAYNSSVGDPVDLVECCEMALSGSVSAPCGPNDCLNVSDNQCVLSAFEDHLIGGGTDPAAMDGEIHALNSLVAAAAFLGNQRMVDAVTERLGGGSITEELIELSAGLDNYAWAEQKIFVPYRLATLGRLDTANLDPLSWNVFVSLFNLMTRSQQGVSKEARLRIREVGADPQSIRDELQSLSESGYLRAAALGELVTRLGGGAPPAMPEHRALGQAVTELANQVRNTGLDRNPLGFSPDYVPFVYRSSQPGATNFEQLYDAVMRPTVGPIALSDEADTEALTNYRQFEGTIYDIQGQLQQTEIQYSSQLVDLCGDDGTGAPDLEHCGESGGSVFSETLTLDIEREGIQLIAQRIENVHSQIQIEADRATAISGVRDGNIQAIYETGEQMAALTIADSAMAAVQQALSIASNTNLWNAGAPIAMAALSAMIQVERGMLAAEKDRLNALQSARMEAATQQIELINSAASIKNMLLQMSTLTIEAQMQSIRAAQAAGRLLDMLAKVDRLEAERAAVIAHQQANPALDPSYRVIRDESSWRAEVQFEDALEAAYLATRAFEYETNTQYPCLPDLYRIRRSTQLTDYMGALMDNYTLRFLPTYGSPQQYVDEISVREDILGLKQPVLDPSTGEPVSPQEQFRRLLLSPNNLDGEGGVFLDFSTSVAKGNGVFDSLVCNDRIKTIEVMLVGDFLGDNEAKVQLIQRGSSIQRSCDPLLTGTAQEFVEYNIDEGDTELIQAGVNTYGISIPNSGLHGRSVAFASWRVRIPGPDETPDNADLDLTHLDDIVLKITHEAVSLDWAADNPYLPECN